MQFGLGKGAHHYRQRLALTPLERSQSGNTLFISGITYQVIAPHPLDRNQRPRLQGAGGFEQGILVLGQRIAVAAAPAEVGPAFGAAHRLGVVASVQRVFIGRRAARAHGKVGHGGVGAVVGEAADDGVARAAVGAVGKGVVVVAILRVGHIVGARLAHPLIRRDGNRGRALLLACLDMKDSVVVGIMFGVSISGQIPLADMIDTAERRRQFPQFAGKAGQLLGGALGAYSDAAGIVQHIAGKVVAQCQPVDEGAKTDSLHYAVDMKFAAQSGKRLGPGRHGATLRGAGALP
ncbi:hypothetical protein D3C71_1339320 [compost metagenome]